MLSLSIRKLCTHSPSTCSVQNFQIFTGDNLFHTYTLQAHVRFKIFKFSREIIFSCLHSPHMFRDSLSIQLFGLHSPSTCPVQNFQIFTRDHFFILTLSTHVSGFTLLTVIWFTLSKHMLGSKFSDSYERSFFHAYTLHTCFRVHSPYSYLVYTLQAHVRFKIFRFL